MEDGLNIAIHENVLHSPDEILQRLEREIVYLSNEHCLVRIQNKSYPVPRQMAAFGDPGLTYTFSGLTLNSQPWTPLLREIKTIVENLLGVEFNFLLINRYANGDSCIGQHKDDEADLEENFPICSLSFGETRTMVFKRPNYTDKTIELKSNSMLVMTSPTNQLWSHGIPRQKKRTGVRISLTFRKLKETAQNNKRKPDENLDTEGNEKKMKKDESRGSGLFSEDQIPDGMIHIGDDVFVFPSTFKGHTSVHIRRLKKYGKKFYPTREGVTLQPWWIQIIIQRSGLPRTRNDLQMILPEDQFKIESLDLRNFTFTRIKSKQDGGDCSTSITITRDQWLRMMKQYPAISTAVADEVYGSSDFLKAYKDVGDLPSEVDLTSSLDVSLGQQHLTEILEKSFRKFIITESEGCLKEPETQAEELLGNRVETFNNIALNQDVQEFVQVFHDNLWERQHFLSLRPHDYITQDFLKNVCLKNVLQKTRSYMCPEDIFEYFEDLM